jgi:hypothetical protein
MLGVQVIGRDFQKLVDKYYEPSKKKIDYPRFVKAIGVGKLALKSCVTNSIYNTKLGKATTR